MRFNYEFQSQRTQTRAPKHRPIVYKPVSTAEQNRRHEAATAILEAHEAILAAKKSGDVEALAAARANLAAVRAAQGR